EEIAWLAGALRRDMEEEERAFLSPSSAPPVACKDVMRRPVRTVAGSDSAHSAARAMLEANIGFLVVCDDDGRPVGAITDRDLAIRLVAEDRRAADVEVRHL